MTATKLLRLVIPPFLLLNFPELLSIFVLFVSLYQHKKMTQNTGELINFLKRNLSVFRKSKSIVVTAIKYNCSVNRLISINLDMLLLDCVGYSFQIIVKGIAVEKILQYFEYSNQCKRFALNCDPQICASKPILSHCCRMVQNRAQHSKCRYYVYSYKCMCLM